MADKLDIMLNNQRTWQQNLGYNFSEMTTEEKTVYIKEMSIHLNQEINEMLYELPYFKPWKNYNNMPADIKIEQIHKAQNELIDAWHFFMNIAIALNISSTDLYMMYQEKLGINYTRQEQGYTFDKSYRSGGQE